VASGFRSRWLPAAFSQARACSPTRMESASSPMPNLALTHFGSVVLLIATAVRADAKVAAQLDHLVTQVFPGLLRKGALPLTCGRCHAFREGRPGLELPETDFVGMLVDRSVARHKRLRDHCLRIGG